MSIAKVSLYLGLLLFFIMLFNGNEVLSAEKKEKNKGNFGIKAGILFGGDVNSGFYKKEAKMSISLGLFADMPLSPTMYTGFNIDYHSMNYESKSSQMLELSLSLKGVIPKQRKGFVLRPGICLGYGHLSEYGSSGAAHFLLSRLFAEFIIFTNEKSGILLDLGLTGSLAGRANSRDATLSFRPLIRFGIIF